MPDCCLNLLFLPCGGTGSHSLHNARPNQRVAKPAPGHCGLMGVHTYMHTDGAAKCSAVIQYTNCAMCLSQRGFLCALLLCTAGGFQGGHGKACLQLGAVRCAETLCLSESCLPQVMDIVQDVLTKCPQDPDAEVKKKKREEYAAGKMKDFFDQISKRMTEVPGPFLLGAKPSIADMQVFYLLDMLRMGFFDHVEPTYPDAWQPLVAHEKAMAESEVIKKYREYFASKKP